MSTYENLDTFKTRVAAFSIKLARALAKLPNHEAPWFGKDTSGALVVDPVHLFTAIATESDRLDPSIRIYPLTVPLARLVSFPGTTQRGKFTITQGRPLPTVIAREIQNSSSFEIIDGEAYVAWARKLEFTAINVIAIPCTIGEGRILRVRLNVNRGHKLEGKSLVAEIADALKASPELLARLTSDIGAPGHLTQRDAALHVFALGSAASVNRALAIVMGSTKSVHKPEEIVAALATFRSVKRSAKGSDRSKLVSALIAHKRAIDEALARKLNVDVAELDSAIARLPADERQRPPSRP